MPCGSSSPPPTGENWRTPAKKGVPPCCWDSRAGARATTRCPAPQVTSSGSRSQQPRPSPGRTHPWAGLRRSTARHVSKTAAAPFLQWYSRTRDPKVIARGTIGLLSPAGHELGVLTLMTVHTGWSDIESEAIQLLSNHNVASPEGTLSRCFASTQRPGRARLGGRIGRGVRRLLGVAPRLHRVAPTLVTSTNHHRRQPASLP